MAAVLCIALAACGSSDDGDDERSTTDTTERAPKESSAGLDDETSDTEDTDGTAADVGEYVGLWSYVGENLWLRIYDDSTWEFLDENSAALDLGATEMQAFFKVVLPAISPGILSGFLMAFTLSIDDFVISYYTTGADFVTLPLKIYAMTKKTVKPDMYALSTIIFVTVLMLLVCINLMQFKAEKKSRRAPHK